METSAYHHPCWDRDACWRMEEHYEAVVVRFRQHRLDQKIVAAWDGEEGQEQAEERHPFEVEGSCLVVLAAVLLLQPTLLEAWAVVLVVGANLRAPPPIPTCPVAAASDVCSPSTPYPGRSR